MTEDSNHQPHDKLFKAGFSDLVNAAAFLKEELPPAIASQIDWEQLRVEPGSFVDSHFRRSESDLLFSAPLAGRRCLLYVLFEHQTTRDPLLALRLLRYMVRIWENWVKEHPTEPLPVILPVVLAQNAVSWQVDSCFSALLDLPEHLEAELRPFIPDFLFRMIQLAEMPFEAIRGTPAGILILRTMKAERVAKLLDDAVWDEALMVQLPRGTFEMLLRYILGTDVDKSGFETKIKEITHTKVRSNAMTLAQQYHLEGQQEGALNSRRQDVLEVLEIRFGEMPSGLREEVAAIKDEPKLRMLHRTAVQCPSLEIFAECL